jgi:ABC-2 type transport system permease protein
MIRAILWAQFLSMRLRKGTAMRGGAIFSSVTGLFFYGIFAFFGWILMEVFASPDAPAYFLPLLSGILALMMAYWQVAPVITASFGASIDPRKLMAYPIPHRKLFVVEVLLRAMTSFDMLLVLAGICAGLLRNRVYHATGAYVIFGAVAYVVMNVLLSAGIRSWLERFFLRTRFKELFFAILIIIGLTPQLLILANVKKPAAMLRFAPSQGIWPWATIARVMLHEGGAVSALAAAAWMCGALLFSRKQFERSLRFDGATVKRKEREAAAPDGFSERVFRFPSRFLHDPLAALVEKELRTLTRIARFRMAYGMSCFFGFLIFAPMLRRQHSGSAVMQYALPMMAVYGLLLLGQITYWNSFGFDRSAAQGYFCWPIRFRDALIAKNLTVMMLMLPQIALVSLVAHAFHIPSSPSKILETFVVVAIAALFWFALGNIFSVRIPRAMDPDKMNQMSNKLQALTILGAPVVLLPVVLAYWARSVFSNEIVFAGILAIAAVLGAIFYSVGLDSAVSYAVTGRESMLLELSRSDGPISIT